MPDQQETSKPDLLNWGDRGVLSTWLLHDAWLYSIERIEELFQQKKITAIKKRRLESKYSSFYQNSRPKNLKTASDILALEENAKKMMCMLSDLGVDAYKKLYRLM